MFLDPLAAQTVINSKLEITLIPLEAQQRVSSFTAILERLAQEKMLPELDFTYRLVSKLHMLQQQHWRYQHMGIFLGEILGALAVSDNESSSPRTTFQVKPIIVVARGTEDVDGQTLVDKNKGRPVKILESVDETSYYDLFASRLGDENQSAVMQNFFEQSMVIVTSS